jgi:hypothetical protein
MERELAKFSKKKAGCLGRVAVTGGEAEGGCNLSHCLDVRMFTNELEGAKNVNMKEDNSMGKERIRRPMDGGSFS